MRKKHYIMFDERVIAGTPSYSMVLDAADSLNAFKPYEGSFGPRVVVYSYDIEKRDGKPDLITNETFEEILEAR